MAKNKPQRRMTGAAIAALAAKIAMQAQRKAGTGVKNAAVFLAARVKEEVSVPAPRKRVKGGAGNIRYVATARAIPGAPPRKLSGRLRQTVTYAFSPEVSRAARKMRVTATVGVKARSDKGFNYPKKLETDGHPFLKVTVLKYKRQLSDIVGKPLKTQGAIR